MTSSKLPAVTTLRRWKRDALEQAFGYEGTGNSTFRREMLMLKNFAKVCDILVEEYPHIQNYERIAKENHELRNRAQLREVIET